MFESVTFFLFEETSFFSSSMQDVYFLQQVLLIPLDKTFGYPIPNIVPNSSTNLNSS